MHTKQTKIICSIADNNCEKEFLQKLYNEGMNVVRLNTAHMSIEGANTVVANVRSISDKIGILIDTKGPEVRTCEIETPIDVKKGDKVFITKEPGKENSFQVNYDDFIAEVPVGSQMLIDDGDLELIAEEKSENEMVCVAQDDGAIKNKKSLNIPNLHLDLPALTIKDAEFVDWATNNDIDFIAHSFVRNRDDVMAIQSILNMRRSKIKIIAKIENREGVDNLDEILEIAHGVMVARGDLGIEIPIAEVPIVQKSIIKTCIERMKPVITATQMLHSMIDNPRPTRAEVSDVANAVIDGTDALMLSGETAYGKYAVESVKTMTKIAKTVEQGRESLHASLEHFSTNEAFAKEAHLAKGAVSCENALPVQAIVTSTRTGNTPLSCSTFRGKIPIFALTEEPQVARMLSLNYGVYASHIDLPDSMEESLCESVCKNCSMKKESIKKN